LNLAAHGNPRLPRPSSLTDVLELVLDKGIVIDAWVRITLTGVELLTVDARVVVASVDTYLRFAEAVNRLDLQPGTMAAGLPGLPRGAGDGGRRNVADAKQDDRRERELDGSARDDESDREGDGS
jgi:gas vesicle structural protein